MNRQTSNLMFYNGLNIMPPDNMKEGGRIRPRRKKKEESQNRHKISPKNKLKRCYLNVRVGEDIAVFFPRISYPFFLPATTLKPCQKVPITIGARKKLFNNFIQLLTISEFDKFKV
jgi:hypothetical protein